MAGVRPAGGQDGGRTSSSLVGGVEWGTLSAEQREALRPLAGLWPTLRPEHQRKWIALAQQLNRMSAGEQSTLQGRMAKWAKLSAAQRTQARLNFGEVRCVPADEKRAKWEEYQALPAEERERLAKDRPKPPASAAPALRPTPPSRIVRPATLGTPGQGIKPAAAGLGPVGAGQPQYTAAPVPSVGPVASPLTAPPPAAPHGPARRGLTFPSDEFLARPSRPSAPARPPCGGAWPPGCTRAC